MGDFQSAGQHQVDIVEGMVAASKWHPEDPAAFDVALLLRTPDGTQEGWWTGEVSMYYGTGKAQGMQQWKLTLDQLENIGWKYGTDINDASLSTLVGLRTEVGVKEHEKNGIIRYFPAYLGPSRLVPKRLDPAEQKARLAALFGADAKQPPPARGPAPSPFAQPSNTSDDLPF